jgi:fatty acid desaturase
MKDKDIIYGVMAPWIFIWGMCALMVVLVILDWIFNLGLS